MDIFKSEKLDIFFEAILYLENREECQKFFEDICTIKELEDISMRLKVAIELKRGKVYNEIVKKTGASTATISRVNRCLSYGSGGYNIVLDRLGEMP